MSDYEHKKDRGSLFKNDKKTTPKHPDYRGDINIDGELWWISAWLEETKGGKKYMSLSVQRKDEERAAIRTEAPAADFNEDIPF
jgi:uncharacterized protein (DUF736 family)